MCKPTSDDILKNISNDLEQTVDTIRQLTKILSNNKSIVNENGLKKLKNSYKSLKIATEAIGLELDDLSIEEEQSLNPVKPNSDYNTTLTVDMKPSRRKKQQPDIGYDILLLYALSQAAPENPIGLDELFELANTYHDKDIKRSSLTAKMARWRSDGLVEWAESRSRWLEDAGKKRLNYLLPTIRDEARKERIADAIRTVLNVDITELVPLVE